MAQRIEESRALFQQQPFAVHRDNWESVQAWIDVQTQWRYTSIAVSSGLGHVNVAVRTGLDYAGMAAWLQINVGKRRRKPLMSDLMLMERAALEAFSELRKEEEER